MAAAKKSTKKTAAKKSTKKGTAKKSTAKKSPAKKSTKKAAAKKTAKKSAKKSTKKSAAKKSTARSSSSSDVQLVVASRIKEAARAGDVRVAGDFADAFNAEVNELLSRAVARAKTNGRSTVRPGDL